MEHISNARYPMDSAEDLESCQRTLSRLHSLGIRHGDTNKSNFLIRKRRNGDSEEETEEAVLIDFESARKCDDGDALKLEFENLADRIREPIFHVIEEY